uniref:ArnR1-like winged helix-turn-helix domain-containing protein n=1 Tax=Candidatus Methanomethylicus mesodigestus TaxID=1867258 RepID=A0A7C3J4W1_9CREN
MTELQRDVLLYINCNDSNTSLHTYSWYVRELSKKMGIPESTAKWTLNGLRECMLIESGTAAMRGVPLRLTYPGLLVAEKISKNYKQLREDLRVKPRLARPIPTNSIVDER